VENLKANMTTDLQLFIEKFEPNKFKIITKGIEIRGINDLPRNINQANQIIQKMGLKLIVSHNAEMLSYRGFEVINL